jgi:hypothetical protein
MTAAQARTRIVRASGNFMLQGHSLPRFPLVLAPNGALIEPIFDYLRAQAVQRHLALGSIEDEAYILCAWWDFVLKQAPVDSVNVDTVISWTGTELERLRLGKVGAKTRRRLSRCLDVIGRFHRYLLQDHSYAHGHEVWRATNYIARLDAGLSDPAASKVTFGYSAKVKNGGRPTPSDADVDQVLDALSSPEHPYLAARNWLIARWMRDVGLRRAGVASLTIERLRTALYAEGILDRHEHFTRAGTTLKSRVEVRAAIERFRQSGRTFVVAEITEKGPKTREIKVPFQLLHHTLDFMWSDRARVTPSNSILRGSLWMSLKTKRGLTPKAVGDILKQAFVSTNVRGSGHRLRACFAEEVVFRLYALAKENADILFDDHQILIDAAEELGHSDWRSLRYYLNRAARNYAALNRVQRRSAP